MSDRSSASSAGAGQPRVGGGTGVRMAIVDRLRVAWMRTVRGIVYAYGGLLPTERVAVQRGYHGLSRATLRNHRDGRLRAVAAPAHAALMGLAAGSRMLPVKRRPSPAQVNEWMEVLLAVLNGPLVGAIHQAHERFVAQAVRHHRTLREQLPSGSLLLRRGGLQASGRRTRLAARRAQQAEFTALRRVVERDCAAECRALDQAAAQWPPERLLLAWERILEPVLAWRQSGFVEMGYAELLVPDRGANAAHADGPTQRLGPRLRSFVRSSVQRETFLLQGGLGQRVVAALAPYQARQPDRAPSPADVEDWEREVPIGTRVRPPADWSRPARPPGPSEPRAPRLRLIDGPKP